MASQNHMTLRRLMMDLDELRLSPVTNVSAEPLDSNVFEWHCNIKQDGCLYHVILFFPKNYPFSPPSAEFVPSGFNYNQGATKKGRKGDQICLSIFSDFASYHSEWARDDAAWSPGYTAQTVLLNLVSFLAECDMTSAAHGAMDYQELCKSFECKDCGHKFTEPHPAFRTEPVSYDDSIEEDECYLDDMDEVEEEVSEDDDDIEEDEEKEDDEEEDISLEIVNCISKDKFQPLKSSLIDNQMIKMRTV